MVKRFNTMKKLSLQSCFLLLLSIFTFSSCLKDNDDGPWNNMPSAGLMYFVNGFADGESGLLYRLDGNIVGNPLSSDPMVLKYKTFSGALLLNPGSRKLTITNYATDQDMLIDTTLTIKVDNGYTSFIYGTNEAPKFAMTQDSAIENIGCNATRIRLLTLAKDYEGVNFYIEGEDEPLNSNRPLETGSTAVAHQTYKQQHNDKYTYTFKHAAVHELITRQDKELR